MNKAKKVLYTVAGGVVIGMVLGVLFAPEKGCETRRKLRALKDKCGCGSNGDKETLEELSDVLQKELALVNEKLGKLS